MGMDDIQTYKHQRCEGRFEEDECNMGWGFCEDRFGMDDRVRQSFWLSPTVEAQ